MGPTPHLFSHHSSGLRSFASPFDRAPVILTTPPLLRIPGGRAVCRRTSQLTHKQQPPCRRVAAFALPLSDKTGYAGTSHGANEIAPVAGTRADGDDVQDRGVAYGKPRGVARTCPDWPMAPGRANERGPALGAPTPRGQSADIDARPTA